MRTAGWFVLQVTLVMVVACSGDSTERNAADAGDAGASGAGGSGNTDAGGGGAGSGPVDAGGGGGSGNGGSGGAGTGGSGGTTGSSAEPGSIALTLTADRGAASDAVVSLGVPFAPGAMASAELRLLDANGSAVPAYTRVLASWPMDDSARSVLLAFRATLGADESTTYAIEYGSGVGPDSGPLDVNPDGPITATLPTQWYAASRVIGHQLATSDNTAFAQFEDETEAALSGMSPAWETYGLSCANTTAERTYYDGPHALFQRFIRRATPDAYRRAREESTWYRDNELTWYDGDSVALYACQDSWDPDAPLDWGVMRRMLGQGMLDDFLLTGDPEAEAALRGLGEAFRQNLAALTSGNEITIRATERNLAWPLMGLTSYYAIDHRAEVRGAVDELLEAAIAWQAEGTTGAFEHDLVRPDPDECGDGPRGGSPFMTSLLIDGLMDGWLLTGDDRLPDVVVRAAEWYRDDARTSDGVAFMYLWGCNDTEYDISDSADLNLLISHVFGAAYLASDDAAWLDFGDTMAQHGLDNFYAGAPKQWSQSMRGFSKYLGYRALDRMP